MLKPILHGMIVTVSLFVVTATLLAILAGRNGAFIDLVRMGWFGFVFAHLAALLLLVLAIHWLWRSFPRIGAVVAASIVIGLGALSVVKSYSPEGTYGYVGEIEPMNDAPDLAPALYRKDHFIRLSAGKMDEFFGNVRLPYGRYEKTPRGWILTQGWGENPLVWRLEFSILGIRMISVIDNDKAATAYQPRRIIPVARPIWMPDWLQ
jgi:hypothetical protein